MSELRIENRRERDLRSCEVTVTNIKSQKNSEATTGFKPMTSVIPVRCSTNMKLSANYIDFIRLAILYYWLFIIFSMKIDEKSQNPVSSISNVKRQF